MVKPRPASTGSQVDGWNVCHVVGNKLGTYQSEAKRVFDQIASSHSWRINFIPGARIKLDVLGRLLEVDILHLTCHGRGAEAGHDMCLQIGPKQDQWLRIKDFERWNFQYRLIFANACGSDLTASTVGAREFLGERCWQAGAGAFVGTTAKVQIRQALEFSTRFYANLPAVGGDFGKALHQTRLEMQGPGRVPTWLLYCFYGD